MDVIIKRNIRISDELISIIDNLADLMRKKLGKNYPELEPLKKYFRVYFLENLQIRGFHFYITAAENLCKIYSHDAQNEIRNLRERLDYYVNNLFEFNRNNNTEMYTIAFEEQLWDALRILSNVNTVCMGMEVTSSNIVKSSFTRGLENILSETELLVQKHKEMTGFDLKQNHDLDQVSGVIKNKIDKLNRSEVILIHSFAKREKSSHMENTSRKENSRSQR